MSTAILTDETSAAVALYAKLIGAWNARDAAAFADCFDPAGVAVGFDGTEMAGAGAIQAALTRVFQDHPTAAYVTIVRDVRLLSPGVLLLRGVAGMVPPDRSTIKAEVNAIQTLVASRQPADWKIALFQNTPAAFHGRAGDAKALTKELQDVFDARAARN